MHYALETDTVLWRQNFTHIISDDDDDGYGTWCWRRGTWEWFPPRDRWLWGTICPLSLLPHPPCTWEQWGPVLLFPTSDASLPSSSALSSCSLNAGFSFIFLGFACCCQSVFVFLSIVVCFRRYWVFLYFLPWFCVFNFLVFSIPWFYILLHGCPLFICSKQSHQFLHSVLTSTQSASQNVARSWRK